MTEATEIREEHFDDEPTGVEAEYGEEPPAYSGPWDPQDIRVSTKQFSLRNILDLIDDGDLELAPDFQRHRVWKLRQKSRLIESILLQIPLPAFYFAEDGDGMMRVVDGLQRLSTIHGYVRGGPTDSFTLKDLEYLKESLPFSALKPALQRRINNAQIVVHVIDPTTPAEVKYDIFRRINTGGTPLNAQEIRHCMSRNRSRDFLKKCSHTESFYAATGGSLKDHIRMQDREMVLRFCAFWLNGPDRYSESGSMEGFLQRTTEMLDDPELVSDKKLEDMYDAFRKSMENSHLVFGEHAFRKWPLGATAKSPINRTLFESWSYVFSQFDTEDLGKRKDEIVKFARLLMSERRDYIDSITSATGDPQKLRLRFILAHQAAEAGR